LNKKIWLFTYYLLLTTSIFCYENNKSAPNDGCVSISPLTIIGSLGAKGEMFWIGFDVSVGFPDKTELGIGLYIVTPVYFGIKAYRRVYFNERHSGFFHGFYIVAEYRKMYWGYRGSQFEIALFPDPNLSGTAYHTVAIVPGYEIGLRFKITDDFGITLFFGYGIPLHYNFDAGGVPKNESSTFFWMNMFLRGINIGLRIENS